MIKDLNKELLKCMYCVYDDQMVLETIAITLNRDSMYLDISSIEAHYGASCL